MANSNLNQNNDNAVTAGRRRRKFESREKIRKMLAAHVLQAASTTSRQKRQAASEVYQQCLLASFMFMDFWQRLQQGQDLKRRELCALQAALPQIGPWAVLIGRPLALGMVEDVSVANGQKAEMWRWLSKSQLKCAN